MKKYKFVRYVDTHTKQTSEWVFMPESREDIVDFNEKYTSKICQEGFTNVVKSVIETSKWDHQPEYSKRFCFGGHASTHYEHAFCTMGLIPKEGSTIFDVGASVYDSATQSRLSSFDKGHKMFLPSDGIRTIIYIPDYEEIVDETYVDSITFPEIERPTYKDVRYLQWPGGKHWYAKIGNNDVYVDGKMKWDTHYEAEKAAMKYIKEKYGSKDV